MRLLWADLIAGVIANVLRRILSLWLSAKANRHALTFVLVDAHRGDAHQLGAFALTSLLVHSEEGVGAVFSCLITELLTVGTEG